MQGKSGWFPEFARSGRRESGAANRIREGRFWIGHGGKKGVKKKREKRGWNKSTGVRLLHFRTGCFGGESAPKWYRKEFYMDSFKRNDQRKNKTKPAHFSGCRGALRLRHRNRSFSAPPRPHLYSRPMLQRRNH